MQSLCSLLILIILAGGFSQVSGQISFQAAFWNVENLFDTTDAPATQDEQFTPSGSYEWTDERLTKKFHDLTEVIHDLDSEHDLAILGLAEIENFSVLEQLNLEFVRRDFKIIHKESPDERGIDCALLYDPQKLVLTDEHFIPIFLAGDEKTRDIIEAEFRIPSETGQSRLYVFINHWPSRWGGQAETDPLRRKAAATLRIRIDQILVNDPKADIIIMGDFNDHPNDPSLNQVLRAQPLKSNACPGDLINTTWKLHEDPNAGTIMYRGDWGVLDQIIISSGMLDKNAFSWVLHSSDPFRPDYLIESDGKYAGWPFRMYRSGRYQGGYSDHLPIFCSVSYSNY